MLIFKDIFSGDEMFSDTYKYKLIDGVLYEVYGKLITRKLGDVALDGANPSAEEACEGTEEAVESGVDVVLNHRLMETYAFPDKKSFTLYLKEYMKRLVDKMAENGSTEVDVFKTNINKVGVRRVCADYHHIHVPFCIGYLNIVYFALYNNYSKPRLSYLSSNAVGMQIWKEYPKLYLQK